MSHPVFIVVGHPNQGKSSLVSTLLADDSVRIGPDPGTTQNSKEFLFEIDQEVIYSVFDTPGFEESQRTLKWLKEKDPKPEERAPIVREFVNAHQDGDEFPQETALLRPLLDDGVLLYVIDGNRELGNDAVTINAELEILQWTGRPRIALINPKDTTKEATDNRVKWRKKLDPFFNKVIEFNVLEASFVDRLGLLESMRDLDKLDQDWRPRIDNAIEALKQQRALQFRESAALIRKMICKMLTLKMEERLALNADKEKEKESLKKKFKKKLRKIETRHHKKLVQIFLHLESKAEIPELIIEGELFGLDGTWKQGGLPKKKLVRLAALAGAAIGLAFDIPAGGWAFGIPTLIGGVTGAAFGYYGVEMIPSPVERNGNTINIGPTKGIAFPWIVLDRALSIFKEYANRPHALRSKVEIEATKVENIVDNWTNELHREISVIFGKITKSGNAETLEELILEQLSAIDDGNGDETLSPDKENTT